MQVSGRRDPERPWGGTPSEASGWEEGLGRGAGKGTREADPAGHTAGGTGPLEEGHVFGQKGGALGRMPGHVQQAVAELEEREGGEEML